LGHPKSGSGEIADDFSDGDQLACYLLAEQHQLGIAADAVPAYLLYLTAHAARPHEDLEVSSAFVHARGRADLAGRLLWVSWRDVGGALRAEAADPRLAEVCDLLERAGVGRFHGLHLAPLPPLGTVEFYRAASPPPPAGDDEARDWPAPVARVGTPWIYERVPYAWPVAPPLRHVRFFHAEARHEPRRRHLAAGCTERVRLDPNPLRAGSARVGRRGGLLQGRKAGRAGSALSRFSNWDLSKRPYAYFKAMAVYPPGHENEVSGKAAFLAYLFHARRRVGPACVGGVVDWSDDANLDHWILLGAVAGDVPGTYEGTFHRHARRPPCFPCDRQGAPGATRGRRCDLVRGAAWGPHVGATAPRCRDGDDRPPPPATQRRHAHWSPRRRRSPPRRRRMAKVARASYERRDPGRTLHGRDAMHLDIYKKTRIVTPSAEHILLDSLGGRLTSTHLLDKSTNDRFGSTIDRALADLMLPFRVLLDAKAGDGRDARASSALGPQTGRSTTCSRAESRSSPSREFSSRRPRTGSQSQARSGTCASFSAWLREN